MSDTVLGTRHAPGRRIARLVGTGLLATLVAMAATAAGAALARAVGVALEVPDGGEEIPVAGVAFVTGVLSVVGIVLAVVLPRWTRQPATTFVRATVVLTTVSLVPPFVVGASTGTSLTLVVLHLVAAAVMIPALTHALRAGSAAPHHPRA